MRALFVGSGCQAVIKGGWAGGRAQDLGSLDLVDVSVLGRADQDFGNTGRLRQDTIRHRHTLAGEWIDGLGWLCLLGWLFC